jgi:hypothetical protein
MKKRTLCPGLNIFILCCDDDVWLHHKEQRTNFSTNEEGRIIPTQLSVF